ncbi:hypothetical protein RUM44_013802 [Polyplax serrata]|uniref:Uncharacterized protein n=1 Tax=Polyplax serrata TaxID=468196 RepID=A0ABR1BH29_POLSC
MTPREKTIPKLNADEERESFFLKCLPLILLVLGVVSNGEEIDEFVGETTTEPTEYTAEIAIENVTNTPLDNGMVIQDIRDGSSYHTHLLENSKGTSIADVVFPENHKNFTPSRYYEDEVAPLYEHSNKYQQQYETYYEQKNIYNNMKPVKFEENSSKTYFIPQVYEIAPSIFDSSSKKTQLSKKPFPYTFEGNHVQDNWYKTQPKAHKEGQESNHHEAYYVLPHNGPHEFKTDFDYSSSHSVEKEGKYTATWKKIAQVITALVPLGLLLATITPNVFYIDQNTSTKSTRQRSEGKQEESKLNVEDVLNLFRRLGINTGNLSACESRAICELARMGDSPTANSVERGFWYLATKIPTDVAEKSGMTELFATIRAGQCEVYRCDIQEKVKETNEAMSNKQKRKKVYRDKESERGQHVKTSMVQIKNNCFIEFLALETYDRN